VSVLEVPLKHRTLWSTGDILLRGEVDLLLKDNAGAWLRATFLVDPGSEMTTMSALDAHGLDLPMPRQAVSAAVHTQTGLAIRAGYLRAQVDGMDGTEYVFPCYFLGDPNASVPAASGANRPRKLLGLSGAVNQIRIMFDGAPAAGAPYGFVVLEKK
jgi:hypothetical protein